MTMMMREQQQQKNVCQVYQIDWHSGNKKKEICNGNCVSFFFYSPEFR